MNIEEYISSGILESYVLNSVTGQERQEVECLSKIYPEIKEELLRLQGFMEQFAQKNAQVPRPALKNKILLAVQSQPQQNNTTQTGKIIELKKRNKTGTIIITAAAASIAFILYFAWINNQKAKNEIAEMKTEMEKMKDDYLTLETTILSLNNLNEHMGHELAMFRNPDFKTAFLLNVTPQEERSLAIICWNKKDGSIMIAGDNLEKTPSGKQYQLWAMVNGQPMDMGMLPVDMNSNFIVLNSKVDNPQGFAVTLENRGGSREPTLDDLYLAGNL